MFAAARTRRAQRALARQLAYQQRKAESLRGREAPAMAQMARHSRAVAAKLAGVRPLAADARVLEVGSGAHGLIFHFPGGERVGVDPLADHYRTLFPAWQGLARTVAASGEALPFADASFDVVLCDNVIDHARDPAAILAEIARVLAPGGLLYFTVNVHHSFYAGASHVYGLWRALRLPFEVTPFADHTVHLTLSQARMLLAALPLAIEAQSNSVAETRRAAASLRLRHPGEAIKRLFFKNARFEAIAIRLP
ncbi:MAG: methyltransferase domain-containing protein [Sphingomonadales bacterium]|nr:methyltransferase domain-containing protein [Sphingomonadales bacterium]